MSLIPEEEFKKQGTMNLAPMVDFLFLVIAVFATMAVTRSALFDTEINLVRLKKETTPSPLVDNQTYVVNISITEDGHYKWLTETTEILMEGADAIKKEINKQQQAGLLPLDKERTRILLHIDKEARWEPIAQAIFAIRETGFQINPVYEPLPSIDK